MKRLITIFALIIAALLVPDNLAAQSDAFKRYQNTYTGLEGVSITTISPTLLRMAGGQQSEEFRSMIDKLKGITIIVADDHFDILKTEINRVIKDGEYEEADHEKEFTRTPFFVLYSPKLVIYGYFKSATDSYSGGNDVDS